MNPIEKKAWKEWFSREGFDKEYLEHQLSLIGELNYMLVRETKLDDLKGIINEVIQKIKRSEN